MAQAEVTKDANDGVGDAHVFNSDAWARAATFDCDKASTSVQKVICSDTRLTNLDDQLGRQYKDVLAASNGGARRSKRQLSSRNQCKDSDCIRRPTTIVSVF